MLGFGSTCLSFTTTYSYDKENWDPDLLLSYKIRLDLDQSLVSFLKCLCYAVRDKHLAFLCHICAPFHANIELSMCSFHNRISFFNLILTNLAPCPPMSFVVLLKLRVRQALHFIWETCRADWLWVKRAASNYAGWVPLKEV